MRFFPRFVRARVIAANPIAASFIGASLIAGSFIVASLAAAGAAVADPAARPTAHASSCFFLSQWDGWKSPSPDVLYLKVGMHDVYRVDLSSGSSLLQWPDSHLVSVEHGTDSVCSPIDLQLSVSDGGGFREFLIARAITKLTPEEIKAIPPKFRP